LGMGNPLLDISSVVDLHFLHKSLLFLIPLVLVLKLRSRLHCILPVCMLFPTCSESHKYLIKMVFQTYGFYSRLSFDLNMSKICPLFQIYYSRVSMLCQSSNQFISCSTLVCKCFSHLFVFVIDIVQ